MKITNESFNRNSFKQDYFIDECLTEKYQFPIIYARQQYVNNLIPFNIFKSIKNKKVGVHFFIDDYQFERIWANPTRYIKLFKQAEVVLSPDFSMYVDMPKAIQIYNCYRNRAFARYLQKNGVNVIPTVGWSDEKSFEWCFEGILYGSAVAVSSNGCLSSKPAKDLFLKGFERMIEIINPKQIIFVGKIPAELSKEERILNFEAFGQDLVRRRR